VASIAWGATLVGVEALPVSVEIDLLRRLPSVVIIGLPAPSVRESADRVRSAILASGFEWPRARVVISLAPADLRKEGTAFDLPIAIGVLAAAGRLDPAKVARWTLAGELSLDGRLRPVRGTLAMGSMALAEGRDGLIVPLANGEEAALVEGLDVRAARDLAEVVRFLTGEGDLPRAAPPAQDRGWAGPDLAEVRGQAHARMALEVAAAGGHNLLLEGPPGCGKSMLAARLPSILPRMSAAEALAVTRIHGVAGLLAADRGVARRRPFRAPHHSVSAAALVGGASLRPGEASLAHHGVLFLDEFPEFPRHAREALRGPLEDRAVVIARAGGHVVMPASFTLVAAANPCPCGYHGHPTRPCACPPTVRERYRARLSGPIVDRIDLRVELGVVPAAELLAPHAGESSEVVRARVEAARERQARRYAGRLACNAELSADEAWVAADPTREAATTLERHLERSRASARVGRRMLKVARTLADLDGSERVDVPHVRAAIGLRLDDGTGLEPAGTSRALASAPWHAPQEAP
jgi:magnesium chelatase family protein